MDRIDRHDLFVDAPAERTWDALASTLGGVDGRLAHAVAAVLGCRPARTSGPPVPARGAELPGLRVIAAQPPRRLILEGEERLASYVLQFDLDSGGTLSATTWAQFPGAAGRAWRALVISSGSHALVMRAMLRRVRGRAERGR